MSDVFSPFGKKEHVLRLSRTPEIDFVPRGIKSNASREVKNRSHSCLILQAPSCFIT